MKMASRVMRGALFLGASTIASTVIGFLGGIILAHLLAPNDFGTFALAATLSLFIDLRVKLQLEQKYLSSQDERPELLDTFFSLNLGLAGVSVFLLGIVGTLVIGLGRSDLATCLFVLGLLGMFEPFNTSVRLSIEKQIAFRAVSFIQFFASTSQFLTTLVCALGGWGLWSLLVGQATSTLTTTLWFWRIAPRRPCLRFDRSLARDFLSYGFKYGATFAVAVIVLTQFDNFIIGLFSGTFLLGFYDRAYRTALWPTLIVSTALGRISLPTYSQLQDDPVRLGKAFSIVMWTVLTFTAPIALTLLVTAPDLVPTLYGEKWLPSIPILQVLAVFSIVRPLWDNLVSILVATKRAGQMARLVAIQAIVLIALATPLTWFYGGLGTAMSVGIAFMISAGFLIYFGHVYLKVNLKRVVVMPLFNNLVTLGLYFLIRFNLPLDPMPLVGRLSIEVILLLGLYGLTSLVFSRRIIVEQITYMAQLVRGQ